MELVPIIYTALIIFAILAVVTIVISYILYRIRLKNGIGEEDEGKPILHLKPDMIKSEVANQVNPIQTSKPKERNEPVKPSKRKKHLKPKQKNKPDPIKNNKRIKILNQMPPREASKKAFGERKVEKTPLDKTAKKYSEDDSEFFRLDTSKKKQS